MPIAIATGGDVSQAPPGQQNAPKAEKPKPLADKAGELKQVKQLAPKVADKPEITTDAAAQPTPKAKAETKAEPKPTEKAEKPKPADLKPDQIGEKLKKEEAKKSKPEKKEPQFKPDQIAEELRKDEARKRLRNSTPVKLRRCMTNASRGARWRPPKRPTAPLHSARRTDTKRNCRRASLTHCGRGLSSAGVRLRASTPDQN